MHCHSKGYQQGLQGWPTDVCLITTCISFVYESLNHGFMCIMKYLCSLKTLEYVSTLEKKLPTIFFRGKCYDTTCNILDIKSMQKKMLEMAYEQQYNQNNTTIILTW
jgi:hypothetical protein